jgi:Tol biopolymer transport system component
MTRIAYWTESIESDDPVHLFVMDARSAEPRLVSVLPPDIEAVELSWSPDGSELGVTSRGPSEQAFVVDVGTGEVQPVSRDRVGPWSERVYP